MPGTDSPAPLTTEEVAAIAQRLEWHATETERWACGDWDCATVLALIAYARAERQAGQHEVFVAMANYARSGDSAVFEERMLDAIGGVKAALTVAARRDAQEG